MVAVGNPCTWTITGLILTTLCSTNYFLYRRFENVVLNEDVVIASQDFQDSPIENLDIAPQSSQDSPIEDFVGGTAEKLLESAAQDKKDDLVDKNASSKDSLPMESQVPEHTPNNSVKCHTNLLPEEKDLIEPKEAPAMAVIIAEMPEEKDFIEPKETPTMAVISVDPKETDLIETDAYIEATSENIHSLPAETEMMEPEVDNYIANKFQMKLSKLMSKGYVLPIVTLPGYVMTLLTHVTYEKLVETWSVYKRSAATLKEHDDGSGFVSDSAKFHVEILAVVMGSGLVFYYALRIACKIIKAKILLAISRFIARSQVEQVRLRESFEQKCIEANSAAIKAKEERRERLLAMEDKLQFLIDCHPQNPKNMTKMMKKSISTASI